jgi:hypothetical protein
VWYRKKRRLKINEGDPVEMVSTTVGSDENKKPITGLYVRNNIWSTLLSVLECHERHLHHKFADSGIREVTRPTPVQNAYRAQDAAALAKGMHHCNVPSWCVWNLASGCDGAMELQRLNTRHACL